MAFTAVIVLFTVAVGPTGLAAVHVAVIDNNGVSSGLDTSGASTPRKVTQRQPLSLFERRSVKHITQPLDGLETGAAQTTTSNHAETVSEGLLTARASAEPVAIVAEPLPQTDEKTTSVVEEEISSMTQVSPHFEDTIKSLAAMLKDYENQKPDK